MADARVGPGNLGRKYESGFGESHFICDPPAFISVHARRWKVPLAFGKAWLTDRRVGQ